MKAAIITDTHFGARGESKPVMDHMCRFYDEVFFPFCEAEGVNRIFHLGDLVDRRKYINFVTLQKLQEHFLDPAGRIGMDIIAGNHDSYYKNTLDVNAVELLGEMMRSDFHDIDIYTEPRWEDTPNWDPTRPPILYLPWICPSNYDRSCEEIAKAVPGSVCMAHLELKGFELYRGRVMEHGMDAGLFEKFESVFTGHYHTKSSRGNIHYLGAPYEMIWTDYDDPRGFHVWDTEKKTLEHVENPYRLHAKVHYKDDDLDLPQLMSYDFSQLEGKIVKLIVAEKANQYWFEKFYAACDSAKPASLQVVEDHHNLNTADVTIPEDGKDYLQVLDEVIDEQGGGDAADLKRLMHELWLEAQAVAE